MSNQKLADFFKEMYHELENIKKEYDELQYQLYYTYDGDGEPLENDFNHWGQEYLKWKNKLLPYLNKSYKVKLKRILASSSLDKDFLILKSILRDMYFKYMNKNNNKENIEIQKLLQAREENIDFEIDFLEIFNLINCQHYLGLSIENILKDLGYVYTSNLEQLNIKEIHDLISNGLFRKKYYKNHIIEYKVLMSDVTNYFEEFMSNSLSSQDNIDLSTVLDMNINVELLFHNKANTKDKKLNELIEEAKDRFISNDKKVALEKLWDAYERLKTHFSEKKNKSTEELITIISQDFDKDLEKYKNSNEDDDCNKNFIEAEFHRLTKVGNNYQIRHYEIDKKEVSSQHINYYFFRMLSLIDLCLMYLNEEEI